MMDQDPQTAANNIIQLTNSTPFGVGGRRACYVHPDDASKCIKVLRQDEQRTVRIQKKGNLFPRSWRASFLETNFPFSGFEQSAVRPDAKLWCISRHRQDGHSKLSVHPHQMEWSWLIVWYCSQLFADPDPSLVKDISRQFWLTDWWYLHFQS